MLNLIEIYLIHIHLYKIVLYFQTRNTRKRAIGIPCHFHDTFYPFWNFGSTCEVCGVWLVGSSKATL